MFQYLLEAVSRDVANIRSIIQTSDRLREIASNSSFTVENNSGNQTDYVIKELIQNFPEKNYWRVYDHCAVVTRLYAVYERFVENLISDWLQFLPDVCPDYLNLEDSIKNAHRSGVGRLLCNLGKPRFEHLTEVAVMRGLFDGITGGETYKLLPDAFLLHEQNLWRNILEELFKGVGIQNSWHWVEKHRGIKQFIEEVRANENTAEGELQLFISYRNDAAHGTPVVNILRSNALLQLCDFIENLCQALAELVLYHIITKQTNAGQAKYIGKITRWFPEPKAARAKVQEIILDGGTSLVLLNEQTSYCCPATIETLRLEETSENWVDVEQVNATEEIEVGLKFNIEARKGLQIYVQCQQQPPQSDSHSEEDSYPPTTSDEKI